MTPAPPADLDARLARLARAPQLLVACDYDGTVAPLVDDPMQATPLRDTVIALRALAELPQTEVAIISGRSLRDLATLSRLPTEVHLVGSHGSEFDIGYADDLAPEAVELRRDILARVRAIAADTPGSFVEAKPAAVAFHYRAVSPSDAQAALASLEDGPCALPGVHVRHGDMVCELLVVETDKGTALQRIRSQVNASCVLYLGDSITDEDAFETLAGPDVGVRVGPPGVVTAAAHRVDDTGGVAALLARLLHLRAGWLTGAAAVPIDHHSLLSDQRTAALLTPDAEVAWYCVPRIDSAAVFASLVGGPSAGTFAVAPLDGAAPTSQAYEDGGLVLRTTWPTMAVTDYLDCSNGRTTRLAGRSDLIRVLDGKGSATITFAPRLDFGRMSTRLEIRPDGLEVIGANDLLALYAPGVTWTLEDDGHHHTATATVDLDDGPVVLEFRCGTASLRPDAVAEIDRRSETNRFWSDWVERLVVPDVHEDLVRRSALTLRAMVYGPTGAIVAAPTTSLPEHLGGVRNWDYRYCWLRDAALTASALVRLGSLDEGMSFLDWVLFVLDHREDHDRINPLYNVSGRHLPPEAEITELAGYAGSRPVRVGNAADRQVQLDVAGPIVELVGLLLERGAPLSARHWQLVETLVGAVERRWAEPDHGIWEIRKPPRHHVYSRAMCWFAVDRALAVADHLLGRTRVDWEHLRDAIAADVLSNGWKPEVGSFTAAFDGTDLDASVLVLGTMGLVAPDDERFAATVAAVEAGLRRGPTVYRYLEDDGLPGAEGGFHLMTSWLIDAYHLVGRVDDARSLLDDLAALAGPTGLLSEEHDPETGQALGNHPQAYSHLGVINNALRLAGRWER